MPKPQLDGENARQGETSGRVRIVLVMSIVGAVAALGAVIIFAG